MNTVGEAVEYKFWNGVGVPMLLGTKHKSMQEHSKKLAKTFLVYRGFFCQQRYFAP
jgi:ketol-acid reductoisomerase